MFGSALVIPAGCERANERYAPPVDEDDTGELRDEQRRRAEREAALARQAQEAEEAAAHARRSDKASYLEEKLEERRRSES